MAVSLVMASYFIPFSIIAICSQMVLFKRCSRIAIISSIYLVELSMMAISSAVKS
jgi:hypothetical protein